MTVFIFLPRFVEPIQAGSKHQTIRATARCKPEDLLSLRHWAGLPYRSKQREIIPPVVCEVVRPLTIRIDRLDNRADITIGDEPLSHDEVCRFVRADGFRHLSDFVEHWHARDALHFEGVLIEWAARPAEGGGL
jgi:hypothetical protein